MKHLVFASALRVSGVVLLLVAGMADAAGASPPPSDRHGAPRDAASSWRLALEWRLATECTAPRAGWPLAFRWTPNGPGRGVRLVVDACLPLPPRAVMENGRRS